MNLPTAHLTLLWTVFITNEQFENEMLERGTSALHFNEPTWIIDGFNELIVDFLFAYFWIQHSVGPSKVQNKTFFF